MDSVGALWAWIGGLNVKAEVVLAIVGLVAGVGNWLGHQAGGHISGLAAVAFLIAGAFLTLHLASEPFRDDREKNANARD